MLLRVIVKNARYAQKNLPNMYKVYKIFFSVLGQQQHFFDSRLTYHASRSAVGVAMGAVGYPLANNWGYQNYSSYLGYNSGVVGSAYQTPLSSYGSPVLDPLLSTGTAPVSSDTTSPSGRFRCCPGSVISLTSVSCNRATD